MFDKLLQVCNHVVGYIILKDVSYSKYIAQTLERYVTLQLYCGQCCGHYAWRMQLHCTGWRAFFVTWLWSVPGCDQYMGMLMQGLFYLIHCCATVASHLPIVICQISCPFTGKCKKHPMFCFRQLCDGTPLGGNSSISVLHVGVMWWCHLVNGVWTTETAFQYGWYRTDALINSKLLVN